MKRSMIVRLAALTLAGVMSLGFASCGSSDSSSKSDTAGSNSTADAADDSQAATESQAGDSKEITGETTAWGVYTFMLPEGWKLRTGDVFDDNDPEFCSIKKSDFSYFSLNCETEEVQKRQYEYNKKTYTLEQKDLPATTLNGIEWNGFEYGNDFSKGFEIYGSSNGRFLRVSGVGFAFDSAEAKAVLGSLSVSAAKAESAAEGEAESAAEAEV